MHKFPSIAEVQQKLVQSADKCDYVFLIWAIQFYESFFFPLIKNSDESERFYLSCSGCIINMEKNVQTVTMVKY